MKPFLRLSILALMVPVALAAAEGGSLFRRADVAPRRAGAFRTGCEHAFGAGGTPALLLVPGRPETFAGREGSYGMPVVPWSLEPRPWEFEPEWSSEALLLPPWGQEHRREGPQGRRARPMPPRDAMQGHHPGPPPMLPPLLMERLRDLPPEEQEKVLQNNQRFQELPKEQQERLLRRLRRFQSLTPEQREMIRQRFEAFRKLTPEQRQKAREIYQQKWRALPEDRRKAVVEEFRKMREMAPDEREKYLDSPEVENRFSADERDLLKQLGTFAPPPPHFGGPPRHFGPPPGPPPEPPAEPRP